MNEGGSKPELAGQVTEGSESNENDLHSKKKKKNHFQLEVRFSIGIPYKIMTEKTVFEFFVLHTTIFTVPKSGWAALCNSFIRH